MKQTLIILLTLLILQVNAQTSVYHPFPDSNAIWNCSYLIDCLQGCNYEYGNFSLIIDGDTLISGSS